MTQPASPFATVVEDSYRAIEDLCATQKLPLSRLPESWAGWLSFEIQGKATLWILHVDCNWASSSKLPCVRISETPRRHLAHVDRDGVVCVRDTQGLSFDVERRADVIAYTVGEAFTLLELSDQDARTGLVEFYNELEGNWRGLPGKCVARAAVEVDGGCRQIAAYANTRDPIPDWYFTERSSKPPIEFPVEKIDKHRAMYVHLETHVAPPASGASLSGAYVNSLRAEFTTGQEVAWKELVGTSKNGPRQYALLVSFPRGAGGTSLIGISFWAIDGEVSLKQDIRPLEVRRHTASYMRERGGASLALVNAHVVVIGCGAVGSEVADALASAGVSKLTLVDEDEFSEDNVFRHVLQPMWIGCAKVGALKRDLESKYPGLEVVPERVSGEKWLNTQDVRGIDGIVVAIGHPTVERALARQLRTKGIKLPVVFTWLEPLDLGGHSVLLSMQGPGCLDCIYRDSEGVGVQYPRTSFLVSNQRVSRNLTGCGSVFTPYGAIQARRTALLAAEHILSALNGKGAPDYRYWVGEGAAASTQQLQTTLWWNDAPQVLPSEATRIVFGRPCSRCRIST